MDIQNPYLMRSLAALTLLMSSVLNVGHAAEKPLKLIELFTSLGCSACPKADDLIATLVDADEELLPYSQSAYSDRQRLYNKVGLRGRPGVYTPQAVINGRVAAVGSDKRRISKALKYGIQSVMTIDIAESNAGVLSISVSGSEADRARAEGAEVLLVDYIDKTVTKITGGENRHKTLTNHHVATAVKRLGRVGTDAKMTYSIDKPGSDMGCIVLIQDVALNPVYAAASCP